MDLKAFLDTHGVVAEARLATVAGSAPREAGARMLIAPEATHATIGGGRLEHETIARARALLAAGEDRACLDLALGPETGQCCGGRVAVAIRRLGAGDRARLLAEAAAEAARRPLVLILGAGHVGRALGRALVALPVRPVLVDGRAAELALGPPGVETRCTALPEAEIRAAPPGSAFVVMTHDHALDFLLTAEALARRDGAYVGLIGSATKRARFERWLRESAPGLGTGALVCPIGAAGRPDRRPAVIAAFVAAEVMAALASAAAAARDAAA